MGKCLYLECASGISGDMFVAAMLDLGGNRQKLEQVLQSLPIPGEFHLHITRGKSYSIEGCVFNVHCHEDALDHHDHDHHHHRHDHDHHEHAHTHRNLADVLHIIDHADISDRARMLTEKIFRIVAEAEARAHGCPVEEVHFHEVGAVDSIVDITAAAVLIDDLDITDCIVESLAEGSGYVNCQHGRLPVPVPAVLNIAQAHQIPLKRTQAAGEMVTPTGIAIAAALRTSAVLPGQYQINRIGIGVGSRDFGHANILRAMLIEKSSDSRTDQICILESNIDDSTGEQLGLAMEKLMAAGALDVSYTPCFMKKNRPGYLLRVIAPAELTAQLEYVIFSTTTTIGIRRYAAERSCMQRQKVTVQTPYGAVEAKKCSWQDICRIYPEYESVKALAESTGKDFQSIYRAALNVAME